MMGQMEVFEFLKKHKDKWYLSKDIAKHFDTNYNNVVKNLCKLRNYGFIKTKVKNGRTYEYRYVVG